MKLKQFRNLKTFAERKFAADPEHKPYVRGRRSVSALPEPWDDICHARRGKETRRQKLQSRRNFRESIRFIEPESPTWVDDYLYLWGGDTPDSSFE